MANKLSLSSFGEGQPIVFIHGWGLNSGVWLPIAQELQSDFQVITIDLPGFGQNLSTIPAQYSLTNVAEMIADAIPDNAILVGWSLGGLVATQIALDFPNKVKSLSLLQVHHVLLRRKLGRVSSHICCKVFIASCLMISKNLIELSKDSSDG